MIEALVTLPRGAKQFIALTCDLTSIPLAIWLAFCLRLDRLYEPAPLDAFVFASTSVLTVIVFTRLGLYRAVIRFANLEILTTVLIGVTFSTLTLAFVSFLFQSMIPRSVPFIFFGMAIFTIGGTRLAMKKILTGGGRGQEKVAIFGAGTLGLQVALSLVQSREFRPVAFLDEDAKKRGSIIQGMKVYQPIDLEQLVDLHSIDIVLLAIANLPGSQKVRIVNYLSDHNLKVQTIPAMADIVSGKASFTELRNIEIEELLGREPVPPNEILLTKCIQNKRVLVTGAGGSIGSELCRQIMTLNPSQLIMLDLSEYALYRIEQELANLHRTENLIGYLGDVRDDELLGSLISKHNVDTVYHTAAYKHVPIVERNCSAGIRNNVFGTLNTAKAALGGGVDNFVLVSTDKAVRPTSLMGASKRIAELIIEDMASQSTTCRFSIVRFGNVLDSSGSVVPLFNKQIAEGGPVTVTHPEITRYFMTISEAVQLVIQSSALAEGGDVFVLDMGEPIPIVDLAATMIRLLGKSIRTPDNPDGEIEIQFTGLRPGEKLHEELVIGENLIGTQHPRIMKAIEEGVVGKALQEQLNDLHLACSRGFKNSILKSVVTCVPDYNPSVDILSEDTAQNNLIHLPKTI